MSRPATVLRLAPHEGGGYLAEIPSLPGCVGDGATREAALADVRKAEAAWVEEARRLGRAIPGDRA